MTSYGMEDQFEMAELAMLALEKNERIRALLPSIGLEATTSMSAGQALYDQAKAQQREQTRLEGQIKRGWAQLAKQHTPAWETYRLHLERAMTAIKDPELIAVLDLKGSSEKARPGQLREMRKFYGELLLRDDAIALLELVSVSRADLEAAQQVVQAMKIREQDLFTLENTKQSATTQQKRAFEALELWHKDLVTRVEIACGGDPEVMKAFGLDKFKKRKKADEAKPQGKKRSRKPEPQQEVLDEDLDEEIEEELEEEFE